MAAAKGRALLKRIIEKVKTGKPIDVVYRPPKRSALCEDCGSSLHVREAHCNECGSLEHGAAFCDMEG